MKSTIPQLHDVAVVGGGPAGLHAAALLSARGFRVVLFEEHHAIGEPVHCTGLIAAETYEQFDLPADAVLNRLRMVRFYPPSRQVFEYTTDRDEPLVVNRALFDRRLAERARERGVLMRIGVKIRDVSLEDDGVAIHQADGEVVRARVCVLACGANYSLHRRLGLGMPTVFLQSAQAEIGTTSENPSAPMCDPRTPDLRTFGHLIPDPRSRHSVDGVSSPPTSDPRSLDSVEIHFGDRVAPRGFAWAVPVDWPGERRLRIGLMCETEAATHFQWFLADVARRHGVAATDTPLAVPRLKMLPLAPIPRTYGHRLVAVGDAAGLVKATTGGGVYYGLVSATLAADVLAGALARNELGEGALSRYEDGWRGRLGAELDAQLSLRAIAERLSDEQIEGLFDLARHDGVMPIVRRTARFNEHRELIVSLLKHPPVRQLLCRGLTDRTRRFAASVATRWLGAGPLACASEYVTGRVGDPASAPQRGCRVGDPASAPQRGCRVGDPGGERR